MQKIANAGAGLATGTTPWYQVSDTAAIITALGKIAAKTVSCSVAINPGADDDISRIQVKIMNSTTEVLAVPKDPVNGWVYGSENKAVELKGTSCQRLKTNLPVFSISK